ncbi:hypothetical protein TgHK011_007298 [Trichoderma gracile]|nr:hypothetical protein TgHK011_007298 [Trichoderma gracile]
MSPGWAGGLLAGYGQDVRFSRPAASAFWHGADACPNRPLGTVLLAAALKTKTGRKATESIPEAAASQVGRLVAYGDMTRRDPEVQRQRSKPASSGRPAAMQLLKFSRRSTSHATKACGRQGGQSRGKVFWRRAASGPHDAHSDMSVVVSRYTTGAQAALYLARRYTYTWRLPTSFLVSRSILHSLA